MIGNSFQLIVKRTLAHWRLLSAVVVGVVLASTIMASSVIFFDALRDVALQRALANHDASDIDVIWHYGYGFPRYRGGPMFYADLVGLDKVYDAISRLYDSYGDWVKPSELLISLAKDGRSIADYTA